MAEEPLTETLPADEEWNGTATVTACLNPALPRDVKKSLRADYALGDDDWLRWQTKISMAFYAKRYLSSLASAVSIGKPPQRQLLPWFVEVE